MRSLGLIAAAVVVVGSTVVGGVLGGRFEVVGATVAGTVEVGD